MTFDPSEPRDKGGKWTSGVGGPTERAASAIKWIKSPEAKAAVSKIAAPEHIKNAATMMIQSAIFNLGVNDPHVDQVVKHHVNTFATNAQVTRAHARQLMITAIKALRKSR